MAVSKLTATVMFVDDLAKCRAFYEEMLGLEFTFTDAVSAGYQMNGRDFLLLEKKAAAEMVGDEAILKDNGAGSRVLLCVEVDNVDATYQELTEKGVIFLKAPKSQDWGRRTAYFADPEGNLWELWHNLPDGS